MTGLGQRKIHLVRTVLVQQAQQAMAGASEVPTVDGDTLQERLGARAAGHQSVATSMLVSVAFLVGQALQMAGVFDLPTAFPAALVVGDDLIAIENAHDRVRGDERQRLTDQRMRNGVVVTVETQIGRFAGSNREYGIAIKSVCRKRQEARALLG